MKINKLTQDYLTSKLEFDLPEITVRNYKYQLTGCGTIRLDDNGIFYLKFFTLQNPTLPEYYFLDEYNKNFENAGKLISKNDFFELNGKIGSKNLHSAQMQVRSYYHNIVVFKILTHIKITEEGVENKKFSHAKIKIANNVTIPMNSGLKKEIEFPSKKKQKVYSRNSLFIKTKKEEILMFNNSNIFEIQMEKNSSTISTEYLNDIVKTLSFIIGDILNWNIIELYPKIGNNQTYIEQKLKPINRASLSKAPFNFHTEPNKKDIPNLFEKFLEFIVRDDKGILENIVHRTFASSYSSLDVYGLDICVSIEELLNEYFKNKLPIAQITDSEKDEILKKLEKVNPNNQITNRLRGLVDSIDKPRAKDLLHALTEKHVITKNQIKSFNSLRNASAHGNIERSKNDNKKLQKHLDLIYKNLVLFNQLVFLLIDYQGIYTNYGIYGHPSESFNHKL